MTISDEKLCELLRLAEICMCPYNEEEDWDNWCRNFGHPKTVKAIAQELIESRSEISRMKGKCLCDCIACDSCLPGNGIEKLSETKSRIFELERINNILAFSCEQMIHVLRDHNGEASKEWLEDIISSCEESMKEALK